MLLTLSSGWHIDHTQYKMSYCSVKILLAIVSLANSAVKWQKKLNSDIFPQLVQQERGEKAIAEEEGCMPGFFCMFFEEDLAEGDIKAQEDNEKNEEKVEYQTIHLFICFLYLKTLA